MPKKIYTIEIEPLTGVHIGTGEKLTPIDYTVVALKNKKEMYLKFSSDKILDRLISEGSDLSAFYTASDNRNMKALRGFFHTHLTKSGDIDYPCDVTAGFLQAYTRNKNKDPLENAAEVLQMYRPAGSKQPVIPGSSLKGAIRTAVLNQILSNLSNAAYDTEYDNLHGNLTDAEKALQKTLLMSSNEKNDPFRTVLIEDTVFEPKNTQLVGLLKNISASNDELIPLQLQLQAEVLRGTLIGGSAKAYTHLIIDEGLQRASIAENKGKKNQAFRFNKAISMGDIAKACNYFFMREFKNEYGAFYGDSDDRIAIIKKLKDELDKIDARKDTVSNAAGCFMIRVGRWSQVEFVTLEKNFRQPKVPTKGGKSRESGTTRTVFDYDGEYVPLGWCKCTYTEQK
jgi:CRISPR-associated RAMP protein, csm5 family